MLLGDFNAHLGRAAAGTVPAEYLVAARMPGFAGFPLLPARKSHCCAREDPRGAALLRFLAREDLLVLNGRAARDPIG